MRDPCTLKQVISKKRAFPWGCQPFSEVREGWTQSPHYFHLCSQCRLHLSTSCSVTASGRALTVPIQMGIARAAAPPLQHPMNASHITHVSSAVSSARGIPEQDMGTAHPSAASPFCFEPGTRTAPQLPAAPRRRPIQTPLPKHDPQRAAPELPVTGERRKAASGQEHTVRPTGPDPQPRSRQPHGPTPTASLPSRGATLAVLSRRRPRTAQYRAAAPRAAPYLSFWS